MIPYSKSHEEVILLKKIVRLCGLLLLATLLFSTLGGDAFAADGSVQIESDNTFAFKAYYADMTEADQEASENDTDYRPELPAIAIDNGASENELKEGAQVNFLSLFSSDSKLIISPPAG